MTNLLPLIRNECLKIIKKKRFYVILLILLVLVPMFTYAQMRIAERSRDKFNSDWRLEVQQQITDNQNSSAATGFRKNGSRTGGFLSSSCSIIWITM